MGGHRSRLVSTRSSEGVDVPTPGAASTSSRTGMIAGAVDADESQRRSTMHRRDSSEGPPVDSAINPAASSPSRRQRRGSQAELVAASLLARELQPTRERRRSSLIAAAAAAPSSAASENKLAAASPSSGEAAAHSKSTVAAIPHALPTAVIVAPKAQVTFARGVAGKDGPPKQGHEGSGVTDDTLWQRARRSSIGPMDAEERGMDEEEEEEEKLRALWEDVRGTSRVGRKISYLIKMKIIVGVIGVVVAYPMLQPSSGAAVERLRFCMEIVETAAQADPAGVDAQIGASDRFQEQFPSMVFYRMAGGTIGTAVSNDSTIIVWRRSELSALRSSEALSVRTTAGSSVVLDVKAEQQLASFLSFCQIQAIIIILGILASLLQRDVDQLLVYPIEKISAYLRCVVWITGARRWARTHIQGLNVWQSDHG